MAKGYPVIRDADRVRRLVALPHVRAHTVERLRQGVVALVGMGGLGSATAPYLAAAGVGRLVLIDPDVVDAPDLGRQILYTPGDIGRVKVEVAKEALARLNPQLAVTIHRAALGDDNLEHLLNGVDIVCDGLDTGPPRDALNRYAVRTGTAVVFAGALGYEGQVMVVANHGRPCLACFFGLVADAPGECSREGVLGPLVGMVGSLQAQEVLKLLMGTGEPLQGRLWLYDAYTGTTRVLAVPARPDCPVCGRAAPDQTSPSQGLQADELGAQGR